MPSAAFSINGGASLVKASVAASASVTVALDSTDGVDSVLWEVSLTDETKVVGDYTFADATATSTTVTASTAGTAFIVRCTVNNGVIFDGLQNVQVGDYVKTAKVYVPTVDEKEVLVAGEVYESDPTYGYAPIINRLIRGQSLTLSTVATGTVTAAYDAVQLCNPSGGGFTVNLPTAVGMDGRVIIVQNNNASTNAITVDGNLAETINGALTDTINTAYGKAGYLAQGGGWLKQ